MNHSDLIIVWVSAALLICACGSEPSTSNPRTSSRTNLPSGQAKNDRATADVARRPMVEHSIGLRTLAYGQDGGDLYVWVAFANQSDEAIELAFGQRGQESVINLAPLLFDRAARRCQLAGGVPIGMPPGFETNNHVEDGRFLTEWKLPPHKTVFYELRFLSTEDPPARIELAGTGLWADLTRTESLPFLPAPQLVISDPHPNVKAGLRRVTRVTERFGDPGTALLLALKHASQGLAALSLRDMERTNLNIARGDTWLLVSLDMENSTGAPASIPVRRFALSTHNPAEEHANLVGTVLNGKLDWTPGPVLSLDSRSRVSMLLIYRPNYFWTDEYMLFGKP